jgi:hypothetical protein
MQTFLWRLIVVGLLGWLAGAGCAPQSETPFAMTLNDGPYWAQHAAPTGALLEVEAGFNLGQRVRISFPLSGLGSRQEPGLVIEFDPAQVRTGQEIVFGPQAGQPDIQLSYSPATGHRYAEGQLLIFDLGAEGGGSLVLETLDARLGGQVKGVLRQATLSGYYLSAESAELIPPPSPLTLKLYNFPFDVILTEAGW